MALTFANSVPENAGPCRVVQQMPAPSNERFSMMIVGKKIN
jgi:hypothetical protein